MSAMVDLGAVCFCQLRVLSTLLKTTRKGLLSCSRALFERCFRVCSRQGRRGMEEEGEPQEQVQVSQEEREREEHQQRGSTSWLGLWGEGRPEIDTTGRWTAEENVVRERTRRAQEVLEELEAPQTVLANLFQA